MRRRIRPLIGLVLGLVAAQPVAAAPPFARQVDLPDGWQPEGLSVGPATTFYVGSLRDGAILRGDLRTGRSSVLVPGSPGAVAVGTEYEHGADRVWTVGGPTGAVRAHDATTGELLATYTFAADFLNDLAITRDAVYVTDSRRAQLDVIPLGRAGALPSADETFTLPLSGVEIVAGFNLNGIVTTRGWLIAVQSNTGLVHRIDPSTGRARPIDLGGRTATNGDGLQVHGSTLYVIRNFLNRVDVYRLGPGLASATFLGTLGPSGLDIPTTGVVAAGRFWVVNARFSTPPGPDTPYWITSLPMRP